MIGLLLTACSGVHNGSQSVEKFIINEYGIKNERSLRVAVVPNSRRNSKIFAVYILEKSRCGSGGCNLVLLEKINNGFNVLGNISTVKLPVTYLGQSRDGYPIVGVWVQGGGILKGYQAELRYDGRSYPRSPSAPPARRLGSISKGRILIELP